jgi:hypothetical protein
MPTDTTPVTGPQAITLGDMGMRPRDSDLDFFGLTHRGRVRTENQDHFLVCTVHPQAVVHGSSLPSVDSLPLRGERLATIMLGRGVSRVAPRGGARGPRGRDRRGGAAARSEDGDYADARRGGVAVDVRDAGG